MPIIIQKTLTTLLCIAPLCACASSTQSQGNVTKLTPTKHYSTAEHVHHTKRTAPITIEFDVAPYAAALNTATEIKIRAFGTQGLKNQPIEIELLYPKGEIAHLDTPYTLKSAQDQLTINATPHANGTSYVYVYAKAQSGNIVQTRSVAIPIEVSDLSNRNYKLSNKKPIQTDSEGEKIILLPSD